MKKSVLFFLLVIFCSPSFMSRNLSAQTMREFTWEQYHFKYSIPFSHVIKTSNSDLFESGDDYTYLQIVPCQNYYEHGELHQKLIERVKGNILDQGEEYWFDLYDCYWIHCYSEETPYWEYIIASLEEYLGKQEFFIYVWWQKGNEQAKQTAMDMYYSIKSMK